MCERATPDGAVVPFGVQPVIPDGTTTINYSYYGHGNPGDAADPADAFMTTGLDLINNPGVLSVSVSNFGCCTFNNLAQAKADAANLCDVMGQKSCAALSVTANQGIAKGGSYTYDQSGSLQYLPSWQMAQPYNFTATNDVTGQVCTPSDGPLTGVQQ